MKKYIFLLTFLLPTITFASVMTGTLPASQTWTAANGPYEVDNLTIPSGITLTIEPGTTIVPVTQEIVGAPQVFNIFGNLTIGSLSGSQTTVVPHYTPAPPFSELTPYQQQFYYLAVGTPPQTSLFKINQGGTLNLSNTSVTNHKTVIENNGGTATVNKYTSLGNTTSLIQGWGTTNIQNSIIPFTTFLPIVQANGGIVNIHSSILPGQPNFFGINPFDISTQADLRNNWWGTASGPNPTMFINKPVVYSPWLTSQPNQQVSQCTENCNSNVVFIPGLMGSRLYEDITDETTCLISRCVAKRWMPLTDADIRQLYLNGDGTSIKPIYTKDVVDTAVATLPLYQSLIDDMATWKSTGLVQDATSTPYDWRLSIDDVVNKGVKVGDGYISYNQAPQNGENPYILDTILKSASASRTGKVTLVAHSNGGLVAKAIMQKLRDMGKEDIVDNLILVASPQVGTPDAAASLLHGSCLGLMLLPGTSLQLGCATSDPAETRGIAKNMPSAYHLLPSNEFFNTQFAQDRSPLAFYGTANNSSALQYGSEVKDPVLYRQYLKGTDGRVEPSFSDVDSPLVANAYLLNQATAMHDTLDTWRPASTTKVTEVAGFGVYTVAGLDYVSLQECSGFLAGACVPSYTRSVNEQFTINGDETVVSPSAHYLSTKTGDVDRWYLNLETYYNIKRLTHKNVLEVPELRSLILNTITKTPSTYTYLTNSQTPPTTSREYYIVRVHSPLNIHLYDTSGNHTGLTSTTTLETNIPGSQYFQIGSVKTIIAPKANLARVELDAYASGSFSIDQQTMIGDAITASSTVQALPTATSTRVTIPLSQTSITESPVQVDYDNNGTNDFTTIPKNGKAIIFDQTPPELKLTFSTSTKDVILSAIDNLEPLPTLTMGTSTITLKDNQNNTTVISFTKYRDINTKLVLTFNQITRNSVTTQIPNTSITYDWKLDPQNQLKDLDTTIKITGQDKYIFNYKKTNQTTIKVKDLTTGAITTTTQTGFVPVTVTTKNTPDLLNVRY